MSTDRSSKPKYEKIPLRDFHGESDGTSEGDNEGSPTTRAWKLEANRSNAISRCFRCSRKSAMARTTILVALAILVVSLFIGIAIGLIKTRNLRNKASGSDGNKQILLKRYCRLSIISQLPELKPNGSCLSQDSLSSFRQRMTWKAKLKPGRMSESPVRFVDVNCDGILDVLVGYGLMQAGTKSRKYSLKKECLQAETGTLEFCFGGVMALDGSTGSILWDRMTSDEIFAISCAVDVNGDGDTDCFIGGRQGSLAVLDRHSGQAIWVASAALTHRTWNYLTPQVVGDYDGDGLAEIAVSYGGDPAFAYNDTKRGAGLLVLFSSRSGEALSVMQMPDGKETYMSPVLHRNAQGKEHILFGSGGETVSGCMWSIDVDKFALFGLDVNVTNSSIKVFQGIGKGVLNPPVIADLTNDGIEDIVLASFDGRLVLLDGRDYHPVWEINFGNVETYALPALGRYNDDSVLDVMVLYHRGTFHFGYSETVTAVVDGKSGKLLLEHISPVSIPAESSPLVVKMASNHDVFIYWKQTEINKELHNVRRQGAVSKRHGSHEVHSNADDDNDGSYIVSTLTAMAETNVTLHQSEPGSTKRSAAPRARFLSTPGITDVDGNGNLDIVVVHSVDEYSSGTGNQTYTSFLQIFRMELMFGCPVEPLEEQTWLGYMGTFVDSHRQ